MMLLLPVLNCQNTDAQMKRARDYGIEIGILRTGSYNAITDVPGVKVGQVTLKEGDSVRTGVTAILPHEGNIFQQKVPAGIFVGNGFGKLAGYTQVEELGNLETPVVLTNTLSVLDSRCCGDRAYPVATRQRGVTSVNAVVGETNDARINDIRGRHITTEHVLEAIRSAAGGPVAEGMSVQAPGQFVSGSREGSAHHRVCCLPPGEAIQLVYSFRRTTAGYCRSTAFLSGRSSGVTASGPR
jgi:D-aminopeptidase